MYNKKKSPLKKKTIVWIAVFLVFIVFLSAFQKDLKNFTYKVSSPIQKAFWFAGNKTSSFLGIFIRLNEVEQKTEKIKEENNKLTAEIANLKEIKKENETLRNALRIGVQKEFSLSFADIIGKNISGERILINKGSKDGILKNMPVITGEKVLLGKVEETYGNFSKVMLLSNKKMSFDVIIQSSEDVSGVGIGKGDSKILIDFVPRDKKISKNDVVISDNLGGIFPKGFLVGKVKNIKKSDLDASQSIEIKPAIDINKLSSVFIIKR